MKQIQQTNDSVNELKDGRNLGRMNINQKHLRTSKRTLNK